MKRYWLANSSTTPPTAPTSTEDGYPQDGNIALNHKPTKVGAWWYHMITEEFMAVIEQAGLEPSHENLHQLADVFADFKERASGAETYKDAAEAAADRAETAATQVVTDVDSAIAKVQAATDSEISRLNTRADEIESSTSSGLTELQNKLTELIANLEEVGGEQAAYVKRTAQEILDSIIPVQTGNAGKFLTTDGTSASWASVPSDDTKLPLSGGTMAGPVTFASGQTIDGYLPLAGGTMAGDITGAGGTFTSLSVGGYTAEAVAESGTNYIRYSSGLQICWGRLDQVTTDAGACSNHVFSYAKEFSGGPSVYVTFNTGSTAGAFGKCSCSVTNVTTTSCDVRFFNGDTAKRLPNLVLLAIGWWK